MYQLHFKPATNCYCLRNGDKRTHWLPFIFAVLKAELIMPTKDTGTSSCILLYEGPTIPTIDTHPELFI